MTLTELPDALTTRTDIQTPSYDRSGVTPGIVHFGVGGFHRAHQAVYMDSLLNAGGSREWGISGVGILEADKHMRDVMREQDNLYTVLEKAPDGTITARVIGSIVEYLYGPDDPQAVLERLAAESTRIVTLTITEGGYNLEPARKAFVADNPVLVAEAAGEGLPRTHFRFLYEALKLRRERGIAPFTVASCDNIQGNGDVARRTLVSYAAMVDQEFARWIEDNVAFPNSMVDRITPITSDADRELVKSKFGLNDAWPVTCEPYIQWVLEDSFPLGRPDYAAVGVEIVDDVEPYEVMKLRLLNASHQMIGYVGFLAGYQYVHEAMADEAIRGFIADFMEREAQPTLPDVPGVDLAAYRATLLERFSNPQIADTIARMCLQTSTTIPNFLLPIVRDQLAAGGPVSLTAVTVAAWAEYAEEKGGYTIVDRRREALVARARDPYPWAFIEDNELFGDLAENAVFRDEFASARESLRHKGVQQTLLNVLSRQG